MASLLLWYVVDVQQTKTAAAKLKIPQAEIVLPGYLGNDDIATSPCLQNLVID
jgi:hypothetical protein